MAKIQRTGGFRLAGAVVLAGLIVLAVWCALREPGQDFTDADGTPDGPRPTQRTRAKDRTNHRRQSDPAVENGKITLEETVAMFERWELPALTPAQIEAYLNQRNRDVFSLLAASNLVQGPELLREAAAKSPSNPQVLMRLALTDEREDVRRDALERFLQAEPENSAGDYLKALEYFKQGSTDEALAALAAASGKPGFDVYANTTRVETARMYQSAGYSAAGARVAALFRDSQAGSMKLATLGSHLASATRNALASGNDELALATARQGLALTGRMGGGDSLLSQALSTGTAAAVLRALPPDTVVDPGGPTAGELLAQCEASRQEIVALAAMAGHLTTLPANDVGQYCDLVWAEGEIKAARWLKAQSAETASP